MATPKRKSLLETTELPKRAKLWFAGSLDGLTSYLNLKPLDLLASEHQTKKPGWVGAYPGLSKHSDQLYIRGVPVKERGHEESSSSSSGSGSGSGSSSSSNKADSVQDNRPYQLEPYTKLPTFTAPDFRERSSLRSVSPPLFYGRPLASDRSPSPLEDLDSPSPTYRPQSSYPSFRLGGLSHNRYEQSSLLRARPRIYASKAQRTTSLLQSKYIKDESLARQRLMERHRQSRTNHRTEQSRLKAAFDATIGALRSSRESYVSARKETAVATDQEATEQQQQQQRQLRLEAYHREHEKEDWDFTRSALSTSRQPAWLRTKYQGNKEPAWLKNFRNLINRELPSVEQQGKPAAFQGIVDEHTRIEKELAARKKAGQAQFAPFTEEDDDKVDDALSDGYGVVVDKFNVSLLKKDIHTLRPGEWLNDEVINFYGQLIMARNNAPGSTLPQVHVFSTFFYKTLSENGYDKVKRWTKKVNLFEKDFMLLPIHHAGNHWTSAVVDMKNKRISYYDSLLGNNPKCFLILRTYLDQLSRDKRNQPFDFTGWENDCPKDIPRQRNGFDCGVFTCTFIEFKSRGVEELEFSQEDMPYLRKKIVLNIINQTL
ncbi:Smt3-specific protease [Dissophora globulifera]|uniref:Smt3-specific protease n=1 Tax=Dissophora globulifera TaxID=979702 RepID=A0A9P6RPX2_9FUNG|nr:Smt3-specific protease [Dissophora globulifera]